jgi:hypothetical protein
VQMHLEPSGHPPAKRSRFPSNRIPLNSAKPKGIPASLATEPGEACLPTARLQAAEEPLKRLIQTLQCPALQVRRQLASTRETRIAIRSTLCTDRCRCVSCQFCDNSRYVPQALRCTARVARAAAAPRRGAGSCAAANDSGTSGSRLILAHGSQLYKSQSFHQRCINLLKQKFV